MTPWFAFVLCPVSRCPCAVDDPEVLASDCAYVAGEDPPLAFPPVRLPASLASDRPILVGEFG